MCNGNQDNDFDKFCSDEFLFIILLCFYFHGNINKCVWMLHKKETPLKNVFKSYFFVMKQPNIFESVPNILKYTPDEEGCSCRK